MPFDEVEIQRGLRHIRKSDPIMRDIIRKTGPFEPHVRKDRFQALVFAIIAQQISGKAAQSIRTRLETYVEPEGLTADRIRRLTREELRSLGVSSQKGGYLLDLAERVSSGEVRLNQLGRMSDNAVVETLVRVKGIGEWTAQMFLIFSLGRLDVLPHSDLGVRTAIQRLYDFDELPDRDECHRIAERWRPYASIATWYCWRSLELKQEI